MGHKLKRDGVIRLLHFIQQKIKCFAFSKENSPILLCITVLGFGTIKVVAVRRLAFLQEEGSNSSPRVSVSSNP